jgi:hypothetical protein
MSEADLKRCTLMGCGGSLVIKFDKQIEENYSIVLELPAYTEVFKCNLNEINGKPIVYTQYNEESFGQNCSQTYFSSSYYGKKFDTIKIYLRNQENSLIASGEYGAVWGEPFYPNGKDCDKDYYCISGEMIISVSEIQIPDRYQAPENCHKGTGLFDVEKLLKEPDNPCYDWINKTYGRVLKSGTTSGVIWTTFTENNTALMISAIHTLGVGWFQSEGLKIEEKFENPEQGAGFLRVFLSSLGGGWARSNFKPMFLFFNPFVSGKENSNGMQYILPENDFFIAVLDSQEYDYEQIINSISLNMEAPEIYDPGNFLSSETLLDSPKDGELVLLLGYPRIGQNAGRISASIAKVKSDDEANSIISSLRNAGDLEGSIWYTPASEFIVEGNFPDLIINDLVIEGMSGSGVFNQEGRLLGIVVRVTEVDIGAQYARIVRLPYIIGKMKDALKKLIPEEKNIIINYLDSSIF